MTLQLMLESYSKEALLAVKIAQIFLFEMRIY
jgi:hypothetical protein